MLFFIKKTYIRFYLLLKFLIIFLINIFFLYLSFFTNFLIKKITVDSRTHKIKIFVLSINLGQYWNDTWIMLPLFKILKKHANKLNAALVYIGTNKEILDFLYRNRMIDGYLYSQEIVYNPDIINGFWQAKLFVNYQNVKDRREFNSITSFVNFMWNNYKITNAEWIGLPICNPYFYWLIKITKNKNISFYQSSTTIRNLFWRLVFLVNKTFFNIGFTNVHLFNNSYIDLINYIAKKYDNTFEYRPSFDNDIYKASAIPKSFTKFYYENKKRFYLILISDNDINTLWPAEKLAGLIVLLANKQKIYPVIIFNHDNPLFNVNYLNNVLNKLSINIHNKISCIYGHGISWNEIYKIISLAKFSITYDCYFLHFLVQTGNSGILIAGSLNVGLYFPYKAEYLNKNQKIDWIYSTRGEFNFYSHKNKKLNRIILELLDPKIIYTFCLNYLVKR